MNKDITNEVEFGINDEESLPLLKCACGREFNHWSFVLSKGSDYPSECPECGRKMYFDLSIKVYETVEEEVKKETKITNEDIFNFHGNLMTMEQDEIDLEEAVEKERKYIKHWLKSKGIEVEE